MFYAFSAALQSSCLSRQVGAALQGQDGTFISTGTNEVPKFGGGNYEEEDESDARCFKWIWKNGSNTFTGCHNSRKKKDLRRQILEWIANEVAPLAAVLAHPERKGEIKDLAAGARQESEVKIRDGILRADRLAEGMPGVSDLIEYSRSIHAEMSAILAAARLGLSTMNCTLYCATFPCHNCARHLVAAGVKEVYYVEPYVKSLAGELHYDSIDSDLNNEAENASDTNRMRVLPFTGVVPRMYEQHFLKFGDLKDDATGEFRLPSMNGPVSSVRLLELGRVEEAAALLVGSEREPANAR